MPSQPGSEAALDAVQTALCRERTAKLQQDSVTTGNAPSMVAPL